MTDKGAFVTPFRGVKKRSNCGQLVNGLGGFYVYRERPCP